MGVLDRTSRLTTSDLLHQIIYVHHIIQTAKYPASKLYCNSLTFHSSAVFVALTHFRSLCTLKTLLNWTKHIYTAYTCKTKIETKILQWKLCFFAHKRTTNQSSLVVDINSADVEALGCGISKERSTDCDIVKSATVFDDSAMLNQWHRQKCELGENSPPFSSLFLPLFVPSPSFSVHFFPVFSLHSPAFSPFPSFLPFPPLEIGPLKSR